MFYSIIHFTINQRLSCYEFLSKNFLFFSPPSLILVRSKVEHLVKTKFVDIVNEMRKKTSLATSSFIAVQKWAEPRVFKGSESACQVQANENLKIERQNFEETVIETKEENNTEEPGDEVSDDHNLEHGIQPELEKDTKLKSVLNSSVPDDGGHDNHHNTESHPNNSNKKSLITILQRLSLNSIDLTSASSTTQTQPAEHTSQTPPSSPLPQLTLPSTNLATVGKNKITELYDKISRSKERYRYLKSRNMDLKSTMLNESNNSATIKEDTIEEAVDADDENCNKIPSTTSEAGFDNTSIDTVVDTSQPCLEDKQTIQFQFDELDPTETNLSNTNVDASKPQVTAQASFSDDEPNARSDTISPSPMSCSSTTTDSRLNIPNATTTTDPQQQPQRRIGIGDIGRSVSDNPNKSKKNALGDIGRSFSVAHDEEAFIPGEGNNSCPNPSSLNTSSIIEANSSNSASNNNVMHASANSVPVSPIAIGRMADPKAVRDALRDRRQLIRDSSFMVSRLHHSISYYSYNM